MDRTTRSLAHPVLITLTLGVLFIGCKKQSESGDDSPSKTEAKKTQEQAKESAEDKSEDSEKRPPASGAAAAIPSGDALKNLEPTPPEKVPDAVVGATTPETVLSHYARWREALQEVEADTDGADKLASITEPTQVTVYFGTWCGDSLREVSRFWRTLLEAESVTFDVDYVGVSRDFEAGDIDLSAKNITYVPTFVVKRNGEELGRVVESAPNGIAHDLFALMSGSQSGVISGREDL